MKPIVVWAPIPEWPARPVQVQGAPGIEITMAFRVTEVVDHGSVISVSYTVAERDTGEPIKLNIDVSVPELWNASPEERIRQAIYTTMTHELDESLRVNGVRVFDPHKNEAPSDPHRRRY